MQKIPAQLRTGIDCLTVPCEPASKKEIEEARPFYVGILGGFHYKCPRCGRLFVNYHPCALHMGLVPNVMGDCEGR